MNHFFSNASEWDSLDLAGLAWSWIPLEGPPGRLARPGPWEGRPQQGSREAGPEERPGGPAGSQGGRARGRAGASAGPGRAGPEGGPGPSRGPGVQAPREGRGPRVLGRAGPEEGPEGPGALLGRSVARLKQSPLHAHGGQHVLQEGLGLLSTWVTALSQVFLKGLQVHGPQHSQDSLGRQLPGADPVHQPANTSAGRPSTEATQVGTGLSHLLLAEGKWPWPSGRGGGHKTWATGRSQSNKTGRRPKSWTWQRAWVGPGSVLKGRRGRGQRGPAAAPETPVPAPGPGRAPPSPGPCSPPAAPGPRTARGP